MVKLFMKMLYQRQHQYLRQQLSGLSARTQQKAKILVKIIGRQQPLLVSVQPPETSCAKRAADALCR
jgi:hypothetical protein